MSTREMGEQYDASRGTVRYWMDKYGIERRQVGCGSSNRKQLPVDKIATAYKSGVSTVKLAEKHGVDSQTIAKRLEEEGVEIRSKAESLALKVPPVEELKRLHHEERLKLYEIAQRFDVDERTVSGWFNRRDIQTRTYTGKEVARWNGGWDHYYGPNWEEQRRKRLEKDGYECVVCSLSNEQHKEIRGTALHVHHIQRKESFRKGNGELDYERANRIENLITLCYKCHNRWEGIPLRPDHA